MKLFLLYRIIELRKMGLLYIDPGSGSYLVQMIIAAILGALFYFKNLWRRFRSFFTKNKKDDPGNV